MNQDPARQMLSRRIDGANEQLASYAARIAEDAALLARRAANGDRPPSLLTSDASQLGQIISEFTQLASRLEGLREFADLMPKPEPEATAANTPE